jgi:hypothetical protein
MGMDIYGKHPRSEIGKYYRGDIYSWNILAKHIVQACPKNITGKVPNWFTNDGYGLDEADSISLAHILEEHVKTGLEVIPESPPFTSGIDEVFVHLQAAVASGALPEVGIGDELRFGREKKPIKDLTVGVSESAITEFAAFLRDCGGFEIW